MLINLITSKMILFIQVNSKVNSIKVCYIFPNVPQIIHLYNYVMENVLQHVQVTLNISQVYFWELVHNS